MTQLDVDLVHALKESVSDGSLVLQLQPEIDLASGGVVGMEALLRWRHPERGVLLPADFLPVAAAAGLMPLIGWWVIEACAREAASWRSLPPSATQRQLWVNVAGLQLAEPGFTDRVADLVKQHGLDHGALGIEVTEETLAQDVDSVARTLDELRDAGVALAVDDFGSWYSSLATIGDLPVDAVKLDQSFVRGVGTDLDDDTIVASVIRLAHARGLYVVAEGVESWSESARLVDLGCDRAFGYLFSPPQTPERARQMLTRGSGWRPATVDVSRSTYPRVVAE
jgi:EAL domain-containing protein (putative c-di-GMP-specific phosphodiesterase class I)